MAEPTLPAIVAAIRKKRPKLLPVEMRCVQSTIADDICWCGWSGKATDDPDDNGIIELPIEAVIAIVQAALWKEWHAMLNPRRLEQIQSWSSDKNVGCWYTQSVTIGRRMFGPSDLDLILALCHACCIPLPKFEEVSRG